MEKGDAVAKVEEAEVETDKDLSYANQNANAIINLFDSMQLVNSNRLVSSFKDMEFPKDGKLEKQDARFYKVTRLSYDEEYPQREAFENVLMALNDKAYNFVYVLTGKKTGVELHIGVVKNANEKENFSGEQSSAANRGDVVADAFKGNFCGSELEQLKGKKLESFLKSTECFKSAGMLVGVPSVNEQDGTKDYDFQGMDRLINSMIGKEWRIVLVCEPVKRKEISDLRDNVYEIYNILSLFAKQNYQQSINFGNSTTKGSSISDSNAKTKGTAETKGTNRTDTSGRESTGSNNSKTINNGLTVTHTDSTNESETANTGKSQALTLEIANKRASDLKDYIDNEMLDRLRLGYSKGMFRTSVYYMANNPRDTHQLKTGLMALFQGNKSSCSPLTAIKIDLSGEENGAKNSLVLCAYQNQYTGREYDGTALTLLGRPFDSENVCLGTYLTTREISLLAGLPQKEVAGLPMCEAVEFGLNEKDIASENAINLGSMLLKGRKVEGLPFYLSHSAFTKHTFVAGTTGSGKTTTCLRLLMETDKVSDNKTHFLVIEPAKTEYRALLKEKKIKDLVVFTVGNEQVAPFRINPFELIRGEIISSHIDMLKATFTSAFPMEASMPQLLEEAIYKCYEDKGWDVNTNTNKRGDAVFDEEDAFPTLSDLPQAIDKVVEGKRFSPQMAADYKGSLVSRLSNLTKGAKGAMLNCPRSIDFNYIIHHNVILELEELKSPEDKALLMGFILSRLSAIIKQEHSIHPDFTHLTLVEEAHRLLSKVDYGDSGAKKVAVETFTDLLAEVRKYGEGLIIVDQIPNKLASEVLKNTNTKIIHRILAKDDKEVVGDTMLMNDKQKEYLSAMDVGEAVIFSENTEKPINVKVKADINTNGETVTDKEVEKRFMECLNDKDLVKVYKERIILKGYAKYNNLVRSMFKDIEAKRDECDEMKQVITRISEERRELGLAENDEIKEKEECWRGLIKVYDRLNGRSGNDRENKLVEFFTKNFYSENFDEKAICALVMSGINF